MSTDKMHAQELAVPHPVTMATLSISTLCDAKQMFLAHGNLPVELGSLVAKLKTHDQTYNKMDACLGGSWREGELTQTAGKEHELSSES